MTRQKNLWARLGRLVYNRRKFKNWSQRKLAEQTWPELDSIVTKTRISNLERGHGRMYMPDLLRLCVVLEITEYDLLAPVLEPRLELLYPDPQIFERWTSLKYACKILELLLEEESVDTFLMAEEELRKTIYQLRAECKEMTKPKTRDVL